jgi:hypothetical protein
MNTAHVFRTASLGAVLSCLLAAACSSVQLVPLRAESGGEALALGSGVELRAAAGAHVAELPGAYTPVRLSVRNTGPDPVYVNLDDIELAGASRSLDAVRPGEITPRARIPSLGTDPGSPFLVQQTTSGAGPRMGRTESVLLEPRLGGALSPGSVARDQARAELLRSAFSGGPIASGQAREGYVFFRSIPRDAGRLTLRVGVRPTPAGAASSVLEIAYAVQSG